MLKKLVMLSVAIAVLLLVPGGPFGLGQGNSTAPLSGVSTFVAQNSPVVVESMLSPPVATPSGFASPVTPQTTNAILKLADIGTAKDLPASFWGVNVAAAQSFTTQDAADIAATPVSYIRFPGGILGEEYNYTSGILTNVNGGGTSHAATNTTQFMTSCRSISCKAILQLPAEIDRPQTAAYYVDYVVNTLHFHPAYFEVGNAVQSWSHFDTPWSAWATRSHTSVNATLFALELQKYVTAIRAVDPGAKIIALGMALGRPNNDLNYITDVAKVDGKNISGVSVHSYVMGDAPAHPTGAELLANLTGQFSLTKGVQAARGYLQTGCPGCGLKVFVTEANAAEVDNFTRILTSFAGTVYVSAVTAQALDLRVRNLDWFAFSSNYQGAWLQGKTFGPQYTLMSQMMNHLEDKTLSTNLSGSSTLYAAATYGATGLALLLVNANETHAVSVGLVNSGILQSALVNVEQWLNGSSGPTNSSLNFVSSILVPALSITILTVGLSGLGLGPAAAPWVLPPDATAAATPPGCTGDLTVEHSSLPTAAPPTSPLLLRGRD